MKKYAALFFSLMFTLMLTVFCFAEDRTVPVYLEGIDEEVRITATCQHDDKTEECEFLLAPDNNFNIVAHLTPEQYTVTSATTKNGEEIILDNYIFTVYDTADAQNIRFKTIGTSEDIAKAIEESVPEKPSLINSLGIDFGDILVLVLLVVLVVIYAIRDMKKKKELEKALEKEFDNANGYIPERPEMKITEEDLSETISEKE